MPDTALAVLPCLIAVVFAGAGIANLVGVGSIRTDFARWGYPNWFHRLAGALEIVGAGMVALPPTRLAGYALLALVMLGALATLVRHRESAAHLVPATVFSAALALGIATAL